MGIPPSPQRREGSFLFHGVGGFWGIVVLPTKPHPGGNNPPTLSNVERAKASHYNDIGNAETLSASERVRPAMQFVAGLG